MSVTVSLEPFDSLDARALRDALGRELVERYGADLEPGAKPTAADTPVFVVARDERGRALACGGLRPVADGTGELKRMFVLPEARGRGLARLVLERLEAEAAHRGLHTLRLETGGGQPEALGLYESAGYREVPCFGPYANAPHSRCYERRLAAR